jgi:acetyltransferase-like isoleucine patch superfamily enzyme
MQVSGPAERVHWGEFCGVDMVVAPPLFTVWSGEVWIGDYTMLGFGVKIFCGHHDYTKRLLGRHRFPDRGYDVRIGQGVWIASDVTIVGPVTIGDHAVVGVGSLVLHDVPAEELWVGRPARFVKKIIFSE